MFLYLFQEEMLRYTWMHTLHRIAINTLTPRQNDRDFTDDIFKYIFLNENDWISIRISLKFVSEVSMNKMQASVQIMDCHRPGDKL